MTRLALLLLLPLGLAAQQGARATTAARLNGDAPRIDGRLDEPVWRQGRPATGFLQREPVEGDPAPEATEVWFLYTEDALYVGARMHSRAPDAIRALVARRDADVPSEQLAISLDTYRNRTTAYTFAITPGGIRTDYFHPSDNQGARDYSFDPVWEAATQVDGDGWTAEVRIPFTQLRFNAGDEQVWGINIVRTVPDRNEESLWVLIPRNEQGWSSRMGTLDGIRDIRPSRRIEVTPYVAVEGVRHGSVDAADPFIAQTEGDWRAGADLKMGLGPALTLEATINPDFGQVEADPAVVNLSAFEVFFSERRPFFTEGSSLFGGRSTFYSRRIGAPPPIGAGAPYAERAGNSTILGAAKVAGRTAGGFSLGALGAATAEERVRTYDPGSGTFGAAVVAPFTGYGIVTGQQEFGQDRSTVKASLTAVERDLEPGTPLADAIARRAWTGLLDGRLRWAGGRYDVSTYLVLSRVEGEPTAIARLQRSSARYFQRPDADHVSFDPARTILTGFSTGINHSKMGGNWLWDIDYAYESPGLELNDLGTLGTADEHFVTGNFRYRRTQPGPLFHNWYLGVFGNGSMNGGGVRTQNNTGFFAGVTWKNFWTTDMEFVYIGRAQSDRLTRGGPLMERPLGVEGIVVTSNRPASPIPWDLEVYGYRNELGGWEASVGASAVFRPSTRWELSLGPRFGRWRSSRQFVATRPGGGAATFGERYLFAGVERSQVSARIRTNFAITPDLTLEGYLEPFASSGAYDGFGELAAARSDDLRSYGTEGTSIAESNGTYTVTDGGQSFSFGNPDFNIRSFRSNLVLRWEWTPGSTAYLVWQQDRFESASPGRAGLGDLGGAFGAAGDQFLAIKISYWLAVR